MERQHAKRSYRRSVIGTVVLGVVALMHAGPAFAVDGVIEINQARVGVGGIAAGDQPGFPVTIDTAGSYRLTGDLTVPAGGTGFFVLAENVTIDLNGFTVFGNGGAIADGFAILASNAEVRNGTVRGFSRHGIFTNSFTHLVRVLGVRAIGNTITGIELQGQANLVDGCTALNNTSGGIRALDGSLVINCVARGNGNYGLSLSFTTGYRSCVLTGNNGGDANPQVVGGGLQLGSNVCGSDLVCP